MIYIGSMLIRRNIENTCHNIMVCKAFIRRTVVIDMYPFMFIFNPHLSGQLFAVLYVSISLNLIRRNITI